MTMTVRKRKHFEQYSFKQLSFLCIVQYGNERLVGSGNDVTQIQH